MADRAISLSFSARVVRAPPSETSDDNPDGPRNPGDDSGNPSQIRFLFEQGDLRIISRQINGGLPDGCRSLFEATPFDRR
ncbi:MAG TPA: hypothetical protein VEK33_14985, partial [Terriglobales bacterium]|nr:hypothetical protein [Terriglobales bacterium]